MDDEQFVATNTVRDLGNVVRVTTVFDREGFYDRETDKWPEYLTVVIRNDASVETLLSYDLKSARDAHYDALLRWAKGVTKGDK